MTGAYYVQQFLLIVSVTAFGFCLELDRNRHIPRTRTTPYRMAALLCLVLFSIGVGAVLCQTGAVLGLALPLFLGSVPVAVLVRNCSEMTPEETPDHEAKGLGFASLCTALAIPTDWLVV